MSNDFLNVLTMYFRFQHIVLMAIFAKKSKNIDSKQGFSNEPLVIGKCYLININQ